MYVHIFLLLLLRSGMNNSWKKKSSEGHSTVLQVATSFPPASPPHLPPPPPPPPPPLSPLRWRRCLPHHFSSQQTVPLIFPCLLCPHLSWDASPGENGFFFASPPFRMMNSGRAAAGSAKPRLQKKNVKKVTVQRC